MQREILERHIKAHFNGTQKNDFFKDEKNTMCSFVRVFKGQLNNIHIFEFCEKNQTLTVRVTQYCMT